MHCNVSVGEVGPMQNEFYTHENVCTIDRRAIICGSIQYLRPFYHTGWISDMTGNYDLAFYVAGAGILISGLMLAIIPFLYRCDSIVRSQRNHSLKKDDDNTLSPTDSNAVNSNCNNSSLGDSLLCSIVRTSNSPEAEISPLFSQGSHGVNICVSKCESVV